MILADVPYLMESVRESMGVFPRMIVNLSSERARSGTAYLAWLKMKYRNSSYVSVQVSIDTHQPNNP